MAPILNVAGVSVVELCLTTNHRTGPRGVLLTTDDPQGRERLTADNAGELAAVLAVYAMQLGARFEPAAARLARTAMILNYFAPQMWPVDAVCDPLPNAGPGSVDDMRKACAQLGAVMARYYPHASGYSHAMALVAGDLAALTLLHEGNKANG